MNRRMRFSAGKLVVHIVLIAGAATMLLPFLWMVLTSFKTYEEAVAIPIQWFPKQWNLDNYREVLDRMNFGRYMLNTVFVTAVTTVVQTFFCAITAYGFARLRFPGRDQMFFCFLCLVMVPSQMLMIPRYVMMVNFKWIDSYLALIMPHYVSIYGTFLLRQYFMALPKELEEAARIDGCSYARSFSHILCPLMGNAFLALGIYTIVFNWNDLLWPLLVIDSEKMRVLSVGIAAMREEHFYTRHLMMTAGVLSTAPLIAIFVLGQKKFINGIALSGIKG